MARKEFVNKKQATILLQAHWRGQSARRQFVVLLEKEKNKRHAEQAEEREALKREEMMRAEALREEQEEVKKQGENLFSLYSTCSRYNTDHL